MLTTCWLFPTDASSNRSSWRFVLTIAHILTCAVSKEQASLIKSGRRWVRVGEGCFSVEASRRENPSQIGPLGFPCFDEACHQKVSSLRFGGKWVGWGLIRSLSLWVFIFPLSKRWLIVVRVQLVWMREGDMLDLLSMTSWIAEISSFREISQLRY